MTHLNDLQRYAGQNREVWLFHHFDKWSCHIKAKDGPHYASSVNLEIKTEGDTPQEAYDEAVEKFERITGRGAPELAAPQLEHQPDFSNALHKSEDDVPF